MYKIKIILDQNICQPKENVLFGSESCKEDEVIWLYNFLRRLKDRNKWCEKLGILVESFKLTERIGRCHFGDRDGKLT